MLAHLGCFVLYILCSDREGEVEDADDPFPKGCVPFLTVHQSKGLEFPVVVLGSVQYKCKNARPLDVLVRKMLKEQGNPPGIAEPLDKMDTFDTMRLFYVAVSRAKNLCILTQMTGPGYSTFAPIKDLIASQKFENIASLDFTISSFILIIFTS